MTLKLITLVLATSLTLTSCLDFGEEKEYEPNSKEAKATIEWLLGTKLKGTISDSYVYENLTGIDPYYYAKFTLVDIVLSEAIDSTWSITTVPSKLNVPENTLDWYTPKIDSTAIYYTREFNGGSKSIIYTPKNKTCFLHYSTY